MAATWSSSGAKIAKKELTVVSCQLPVVGHQSMEIRGDHWLYYA